VLSLWLVTTLTFLIIHLLPGEPAEAALAQSTASQAVLQQRREALGLDRPLMEQYLRYGIGLLRGEAGVSWATGQPVSQMVGDQLPATLELTAAGMGIALTVGFALGMTAGASPHPLLVHISRTVAGLLLSIPVMFTGIVFIWLFAVTLDWLPATGQGGLNALILPAAVIGFSAAGPIARTIDAGLRGVLRQPFLLVARAKGLTASQTMWRHALRVGLLPTLDVIAIQSGYLLGGAVITENVFARQGVGRLLLSAVLNQDLPVVQAAVILTATVYIVLNLLADTLHSVFDPRIPYQT
jgi:peptide/nickel transport system permease protein